MKNCRLKIVTNFVLNDADKDAIIHLYQPILGLVPTEIYFSLIEEEKLMKSMPKSVFTEDKLAALFNIDFDTFKKSMVRLEGMRLIKAFISKDGSRRTYELVKPLAPELFFENSLFDQALQTKLGTERYQIVKVFYLKDKAVEEFNNELETTASFEQAFESEMTSFKTNNVNDYIKPVDESLISFDGITKLMTEQGMDAESLTSKVKNIILANMTNAAFNDQELVDAIKESYDFDQSFIKEDYLKVLLTNKVVNKQNEVLDEIEETKIKEMEEHDAIEYAGLLMEQTPNRTIVNIINNLRAHIFGVKKPNDGVINCLLEYSYWKNDTKIVGQYLYKIADTLIEKGLYTTREVMDYLKGVANHTKTKINNVKQRLTKFSWHKEKASTVELIEDDNSNQQSMKWLEEELKEDSDSANNLSALTDIGLTD